MLQSLFTVHILVSAYTLMTVCVVFFLSGNLILHEFAEATSFLFVTTFVLHCRYDMEAVYFDESVRTTKRKQLESKLLHVNRNVTYSRVLIHHEVLVLVTSIC